MALEPLAAKELRDAVSLAERPGNTATRRRGNGHEIRELRPLPRATIRAISMPPPLQEPVRRSCAAFMRIASII
ncbi:hypothetical protein [Gemmobacter sp. 24YEA27]|uniref:hypothetical protein n=1 Tax=Gemmobacter sp. 24YEA27 TaxID=3040672 RepID=UPI0024B357BF|nr:hypothetical protein [Gemmobacter sp. 24YEA27]